MTTAMPIKNPLRNPGSPVAGDFSLRYLLEIFFRRKRVFLLLIVLTPILAVLLSLLIKDEYISSTTIMLGKEDVLNPLVRYDTAVAMADTNRLGSFEKILYSRPLLEETIQKLRIHSPSMQLNTINSIYTWIQNTVSGVIGGKLRFKVNNVKSDIELEKAVKILRRNIHLLGLTSDSFQIACTAREPVLAKTMVETISQLFIEKSLQGSRREAVVAVNLIEQQVDYYRQELEKTQNALQHFRQSNIEILGQINSLGGQLNEYRTKGMEAELDFKQERLNENLLSDRLSGEKPMVISQTLYLQDTPYQRQYHELHLRMSNLLATREKSHPEVLKLQREIDAIKRLLDDEKKKNEAAETQEILSPVYQEVSARLEDAHIKTKVLEQRISEYRKLQEETRMKLVEAPGLEKEQARMERELKLTQELYDTLRIKLEQARVTREVEIAQQANRFTIIEPPVVPLSRHKPNRKLFIIGGVAGGICLGLLLVFLLEFTDPRLVRTGELLRRTHLRLVGTLPKLYNFGEMEPFHLLAWLRRRFFPAQPTGMTNRLHGKTPRRSWADSISPLQPLNSGLRKIFCARLFVLPPEIPANLAAYTTGFDRSYLRGTPEAAAYEDYRERLHNIVAVARNTYDDPDHLLWLITSARSGEGKTFLTINLGALLADDLKKPVLLVDANFKEASLTNALGFGNSPGLADVLERRVSIDEALVKLDTPGLSLLPAGTPSEDPNVLYNSPALHNFLETLRGRFSFTLIEAPEVLTSSGGLLLAPYTDGILFVVMLYETKRKSVESAIERLPAEKIIGVVFNYFQYWIPDWLYRLV
jgi:polysaccharide chain length determinant protein (PEP-CTERM system associated)